MTTTLRPLKIALIVKPSPSTQERDQRNMGMFSYSVPEFTWVHYSHTGNKIPSSKFKDFDIIFHEDGGNWCEYLRGGPPVIFYSIDDTLSDTHFNDRFRQAKSADLILVDHGDLNRFKAANKTVRRLLYCVNDRLFYPEEKQIDVNFMCGAGASRGMPGGEERVKMRQDLDRICQIEGYSYKSGGHSLFIYAEAIRQSKVVVNVPRTLSNRPHRVYDSLASRCALLTKPIPFLSDGLISGVHYREINGYGLAEHLGILLRGEWWRTYAEDGYKKVMADHTWSSRAQELRYTIYKFLGI